MRALLRRLRFLLHRDQFEQDLEEEMRHHLALQAEERGSADGAQRQFGNITLLKEDSRAMWTWNFAEQLVQDVRYALRMMAANRLFTAMAVLSLALGIGANTAIYSFMDAILLRTLPVRHPEELVVLNWRAKGNPAVIHNHNGTRYGDRKTGVATSPNFPFAAYLSLRAQHDTLSTLFAYASARQLNIIARGQAEAASGLFVSGGFYSGLGVSPAAGRLILDEDDNLLLARAAARRREIAVRLSLGAGRWRIVRQLLTESVMLSFVGALLGLLVAYWGIESITWLLANGHENFTLHANLNWQVLGFTLALALVTGIVFGLAPAIQATSLDLTPALKETRASAPGGRVCHVGLRLGANQFLVVAQIAISLLLVIAAGLFVRTVSNLHSVELGFNRENVLLFSLNARQAGYKDAALARFYADLRDRFRTIPGVRRAGISDYPLVSHYWNSERVTIPGAPPPSGRPPDTGLLGIDASFLATMEIPIVSGRGIEERDMASPRVAVVNQRFAAKFFGKASASPPHG